MNTRVASLSSIVVVISVFVGGCASTQLNYNTLDLASTTDNLVTEQILYNFASFIDNPAAIPAQVTISSGSATTANSITPTVTAPLSKSVAGANVTSTAATFSNATAAKSLQVAASDSWNQSWSFSPVTDPERMKRLQALYRYAVDWSEQSNGSRIFVENFPPVQRSIAYQQPVCLPFAVPKPAGATKDVCATATNQPQGPTHGATTKSFTEQGDDPYYLRGIHCILCARGKTRTINSNLAGSWLHWASIDGSNPDPLRVPKERDVFLGRSGHYAFYTSDPIKFVNFTVAALAAVGQAGSTAAAASSSSSGGGSASKGFTGIDIQGNPIQLFPN